VDPRVADLACQTVLVSPEFYSSSVGGFLGRCCHRGWLRFGNDLLAATTRLARSWNLANDAFRVAGLAGSLRPDRLVTGSLGRQFDPSSFWGLQTGSNPTDRAKLGSKRHLICDGHGVPLAIQLTGANRSDSQQALSLVDAIPFVQGERGRPRHRPDCVLGDRGYDAEAIRQGLRGRHIIPFLAKRNTGHGSGLGRCRWVVERTFAWLNISSDGYAFATRSGRTFMRHSCPWAVP